MRSSLSFNAPLRWLIDGYCFFFRGTPLIAQTFLIYYGAGQFVMELREIGLTPHVAQNSYVTAKARRPSAIDGRTTRHSGYAASQRVRCF